MPPRYLRHLLFLLLLSGFPALAQKQLRVSGTVLQPDKITPVAGAGIIKLSSNTGVVTDEAGYFRIDVAPASDTLLIRAVGYKPILYIPQKVQVSELRVTFVLQEDSVVLSEVNVVSLPSQEVIQKLLRNNKPEPINIVMRKGYDPSLEPPPPLPPPPPSVIFNPASAFSKEGKQLRLLHKLQKQQEKKEKEEQKREQERLIQEQKEREEQAKRNYNNFFKDSRGYE
jgi:hypothetical protein